MNSARCLSVCCVFPVAMHSSTSGCIAAFQPVCLLPEILNAHISSTRYSNGLVLGSTSPSLTTFSISMMAHIIPKLTPISRSAILPYVACWKLNRLDMPWQVWWDDYYIVLDFLCCLHSFFNMRTAALFIESIVGSPIILLVMCVLRSCFCRVKFRSSTYCIVGQR